MVEEEKNENMKPGISKEQKIGLFLLFVFAILSVSLGILQMRNTLYSPFALKDVAPDISSDAINSVEAQQLRDTDRDGLSDFDELYVYTTSIYLADTDSDGINDKEEVDGGKNPLCAEGTNCGNVLGEAAGAIKNSSSTLKIIGTDVELGEEPTDINTILQDPEQIKQLLAQAGVNMEILNNISNEDLMIMVNEVMAVTTTANSGINELNSLLKNTTTTQSTTTKK